MWQQRRGRFLPVLGILRIWLRIKLTKDWSTGEKHINVLCVFYMKWESSLTHEEDVAKCNYFCTGLNEER